MNDLLCLAHEALSEGRKREAARLYALYSALLFAPEALSEAP